jgi:hypothetical protein
MATIHRELPVAVRVAQIIGVTGPAVLAGRLALVLHYKMMTIDFLVRTRSRK